MLLTLRIASLLLCVLGTNALAQYTITTVVGSSRLRDGEPAVTAPLRQPTSIAIDRNGTLFIADKPDYRIRKVDGSGIIGTYAGTGYSNSTGSSGPAVDIPLWKVEGIVLDAEGNLYVAESASLKKIDTSGRITTIAGNGDTVYSGDGGPAAEARVAPDAVAIDSAGNIYIANNSIVFSPSIRNDHRIRKIDTSGIITAIAGTGPHGNSGDGGLATRADIGRVTGLAFGPTGDLYLCDYSNRVIRKIDPSGIITTVAGTGERDYNGDGIPATSASLDPIHMAFDADGNLYVADKHNHRVRKIAADTGLTSTVAGNGTAGFSGDGGPATAAKLAGPMSLAFGPAGNLLIADSDNSRVRGVRANGTIETIAGTGVGDDGPATSANLQSPGSVAASPDGTLYIADTMHHRIRAVSSAGTIRTIVGKGFPGWSAGGGQAAEALLQGPLATVLDGLGNLYIADSENFRIRKVTPDGQISTVAGTGNNGFSGDGGPAVDAEIGWPTGIAIGRDDSLYIADYGNNRIRRILPSGTISTVAGTGYFGFAGEGGPAVEAQLSAVDVTVDSEGNLYVADWFNHRIRKIDTAGTITTFAGTGVAGFDGDGRQAVEALLTTPSGVMVDADDNLHIVDYGNARLRRVSRDGVITTIAGNGRWEISGDGGPALEAGIRPSRVAMDLQGNLFVADEWNDRIRKLIPPPPYAANKVAGGGQTGRAGEKLAEPLTVWITKPDGSPAVGETVVFTVTVGTATLNPTSVTTAEDGSARTTVTLGETPGTVNVTATIDGIDVTIFAVTVEHPDSGVRINSGGVVSAGLSSPPVQAISPSTIMAVFGQGFAPPGTFRTLTGDDLHEGRVPLSLAGVCVEVGGVRSPIFAVMRMQINFQAPDLPDAEVVDVKVIAGCDSKNELHSNPEIVAVQTAAPEFFYFSHSSDGKNPIAAVDSLTGAFSGAPGLVSGVTFTPARPGDLVTLFLTGVGRTTPHFEPGELPGGATSSTANIEVTIDGAILDPSRVLYIGVTPGNAGLYQLNIRLPEDLADGDLEIVISVDGYSSPAKAYITVRRT